MSLSSFKPSPALSLGSPKSTFAPLNILQFLELFWFPRLCIYCSICLEDFSFSLSSDYSPSFRPQVKCYFQGLSWWLRLCSPNAGSTDLISGQGIKISHASMERPKYINKQK